MRQFIQVPVTDIHVIPRLSDMPEVLMASRISMCARLVEEP